MDSVRIVLAGASGFLGTALRAALTGEGHQVVQLVRRDPAGPDQVRWRPDRQELDRTVLARAGAVVNLAGANLGGKRWTESYKKELRDSRTDSTTTIATALAALPAGERPPVLLNASAEGYYGDTGDAIVDEGSPPGKGFLADLCREWEAATRPAEDAGVRVVKLRTGLVLDDRGGLLGRMMLPFKLGVGGKLSTGRQWMPWVSLADWLAAVLFLMERPDLTGPVNVCSPHPVTNEEFTRVLARLVHRPALMPIPRFALRVVLGEFADNGALVSKRMLPSVLLRAGFVFAYPDLEPALRAALHRGGARLGA
jgi:hypothetical protein